MDIVLTKWIVLVALFGSTFIFSMLPLKLVSSVRSTADHVKRARLVVLVSVLSNVYFTFAVYSNSYLHMQFHVMVFIMSLGYNCVYSSKIHYPSDINLLLLQCLTDLKGSYYFPWQISPYHKPAQLLCWWSIYGYRTVRPVARSQRAVE